MQSTCCSDLPPSVDERFDTPVGLPVVCHAIAAMLEAGHPLRLRLREEVGWTAWPLASTEIAWALDGSVAWVTQRPGCGGLVTRVVFVDDAARPVAVLEPQRPTGVREPAEWRVALLLGLAAHVRAA